MKQEKNFAWMMVIAMACMMMTACSLDSYEPEEPVLIIEPVEEGMLAACGISESGTESHRGRMVKRGSSQLRYTLMNCALPLIRFDMTFAAYYAKKRSEGKPHRVAISHVTKKLVRVIFALERQNTDFVATALR